MSKHCIQTKIEKENAFPSKLFYKKGGRLSVLFHPYLCGHNAAEWLINMKKLTALILALATVFTMTACGNTSEPNPPASSGASPSVETPKPTGEKITLKLATDQDSTFVTTIALQKFADDLAAKTDGRITVEVYPGGQLGDEKASVEQLQFGTVDIVKCSLAPLSEFAPSLMAMNLPYMFKDKDHMWKFYDGEMGQELLNSMEDAGIVGLGWVDGGSRCFYTKKLVTSVADLKGLRIRVQESSIMMSMVEALGGTGTPIAGSEIYSALQTGVVDAAENNIPRYLDMSHQEVAKFLLLDHHQYVPEAVIMSSATWNKLSSEDQKLVKETMDEAIEYQRSLWDAEEDRALEELLKQGVTVTELDSIAEFREACQPVYDNYFKENPDQVEYVAKIEALAG